MNLSSKLPTNFAPPPPPTSPPSFTYFPISQLRQYVCLPKRKILYREQFILTLHDRDRHCNLCSATYEYP